MINCCSRVWRLRDRGLSGSYVFVNLQICASSRSRAGTSHHGESQETRVRYIFQSTSKQSKYNVSTVWKCVNLCVLSVQTVGNRRQRQTWICWKQHAAVNCTGWRCIRLKWVWRALKFARTTEIWMHLIFLTFEGSRGCTVESGSGAYGDSRFSKFHQDKYVQLGENPEDQLQEETIFN